jgi:hypothetical protein
MTWHFSTESGTGCRDAAARFSFALRSEMVARPSVLIETVNFMDKMSKTA